MSGFKRGDICILAARVAEVVVLGGPTKIAGSEHYTIRYREDVIGFDFTGTQRVLHHEGDTTVVPGHWLSFGYYDANYKTRGKYNVIYGFCPECDEPDMIFYEGDYICAWCREHLEED